MAASQQLFAGPAEGLGIGGQERGGEAGDDDTCGDRGVGVRVTGPAAVQPRERDGLDQRMVDRVPGLRRADAIHHSCTSEILTEGPWARDLGGSRPTIRGTVVVVSERQGGNDRVAVPSTGVPAAGALDRFATGARLAARDGLGREERRGHVVTEVEVDAVEVAPLGPVDYVVIEFPEARFTGAGLPALLEVVAKGVIRVLDAVIIKQNEDGSWISVSVTDLDADGGVWDMISGWGGDVLGQDDFDEVGAILAPGAAAAIIVYENTWAGPFAQAMLDAGGQVVAFERVGVADVVAALEVAAAESIVEN